MRDRQNRSWATVRPEALLTIYCQQTAGDFWSRIRLWQKATVEKSVLSQSAREAARKARDLTRRKSALRRDGSAPANWQTVQIKIQKKL